MRTVNARAPDMPLPVSKKQGGAAFMHSGVILEKSLPDSKHRLINKERRACATGGSPRRSVKCFDCRVPCP
jgi:hypothetical protein